MQLGIIGLGRMGANIGRRLMSRGHQVVGYDASPEAIKGLEAAACTCYRIVKDLQDSAQL